MMQNSYEISAYAQCDDEYRKGFSYGQDLRFYHRGGFDTFDGAFGFMTEQVEETKSQFMNSTFYYYSSKESSHHQEARKYMYDYESKKWLPMLIRLLCKECGFEMKVDDSKLFDFFYCDNCDSRDEMDVCND